MQASLGGVHAGLQPSLLTNQYALAALGSPNPKLRQLGCRQLGFAVQVSTFT